MKPSKDQAPETDNSLLSALTRKEAELVSLVLASQGIQSQQVSRDDRFDIRVSDADHQRAIETLSDYYRENRDTKRPEKLDFLAENPFKSITAFVIMCTICLIHAFLILQGIHESIVLEFGSSAMYVLQGEYFRIVTALMLHADARHLVSNCAGILIFVAPALNLAGYGSGMLLLLVSGALGNLVNALAYKTLHLSIGSSTFIMAAAGILSAFRVVHTVPGIASRLFGLAAGATLVGMFSTGERTDISAHIFGFFAGFFTGLAFFFFRSKSRLLPERESRYAILSFVIILLAWLKVF